MALEAVHVHGNKNVRAPAVNPTRTDTISHRRKFHCGPYGRNANIIPTINQAMKAASADAVNNGSHLLSNLPSIGPHNPPTAKGHERQIDVFSSPLLWNGFENIVGN